MKRLDFEELVSIPSASVQTSMILDREERYPEYEEMFSNLFFGGTTPPKANTLLDKDYVRDGWEVFSSVASTWDTIHERKTEACGVILHSLLHEEKVKMSLKEKIKKYIKEGYTFGD